jgi:pyruvate ferredoxin oxidoreductase beta subunit
MLEKALAVGIGGIVSANVRMALSGIALHGYTVIVGLGGRAITKASLRGLFARAATVAGLRDLEYKVGRAMEFHGPRYLHILVPCPLGWGSAAADTIKIARLAEQTGLFPVFEATRGEVTGVSKIRRQVPVEEYLKLQSRYAHLFRPGPGAAVIARLQAIADRNIARFGLAPEGETP